MRFDNTRELQRHMDQAEREARDLAKRVRKLEAENRRLRKALEPLARGATFLLGSDKRRARKALGLEAQPAPTKAPSTWPFPPGTPDAQVADCSGDLTGRK